MYESDYLRIEAEAELVREQRRWAAAREAVFSVSMGILMVQCWKSERARSVPDARREGSMLGDALRKLHGACEAGADSRDIKTLLFCSGLRTAVVSAS